MIQVILKKLFQKSIVKFPKNVQTKTREVIELFQVSPFAPQLNRHKLHGILKDRESLDVTGDIRIIINPITNEIVEIVNIGTHSQLY